MKKRMGAVFGRVKLCEIDTLSSSCTTLRLYCADHVYSKHTAGVVVVVAAAAAADHSGLRISTKGKTLPSEYAAEQGGADHKGDQENTESNFAALHKYEVF